MIIDYTPPPLGVPDCVATKGNGNGAFTCPPADRAKDAALVEAAMIRLYRKFGGRDYEVWNEPDPPYCGAGGGPDLDAMLTLAGLRDDSHKVTMRQVDCSTAIVPVADATLPTTVSTLNFSGQHATLPVTVPPDGTVQIAIDR